MAKEAHIRVDIATGKVKVTDENGTPVRKMRGKNRRTSSKQRGKSITAPTIFQSSNPQAERKCIVIVMGGTQYKICM